MDSHAALLLSFIEALRQFERQLEDITDSNHKQIGKAREHMGDSQKTVILPRHARLG